MQLIYCTLWTFINIWMSIAEPSVVITQAPEKANHAVQERLLDSDWLPSVRLASVYYVISLRSLAVAGRTHWSYVGYSLRCPRNNHSALTVYSWTVSLPEWLRLGHSLQFLQYQSIKNVMIWCIFPQFPRPGFLMENQSTLHNNLFQPPTALVSHSYLSISQPHSLLILSQAPSPYPTKPLDQPHALFISLLAFQIGCSAGRWRFAHFICSFHSVPLLRRAGPPIGAIHINDTHLSDERSLMSSLSQNSVILLILHYVIHRIPRSQTAKMVQGLNIRPPT